MKRIRNFLKNENGAALPFITLLMVFLLVGIVVLVIDAGKLYEVRRQMVSAADSAAIAGSLVIRDALGAADLTAAKASAESVAEDIALANGVKNASDIQVSWDRINYKGSDRDVITVRVKNTVGLLFSRIWGDDTTDVSAKAVATWGYVVKLEGGNIIPVFAKESSYTPNQETYLHSGKFVDDMGDIINGNWGLIDIFGNGGDITRAFAGEFIKTEWELNYSIPNQTGLTAGKIAGIETRMIAANALPDRDDREKYMKALVPIIDFTKVTQQGSSLQLPILTFAVFEIQDVIIEAGNNGNKRSKGSRYALYDTADYHSDGVAKEYAKVDGLDLKKSTIVGRFTGDEVEVRAIVEPGDQENPDPDTISATYAKLIK